MTIQTGDFALNALLTGPTAPGEVAGSHPDAGPRAGAPDPLGAASSAALAASDEDGDLGLYLRHVEGGETIRSLAREIGCHASTVLRRIRRFETRRDDPLVDQAVERASSSTSVPEMPVAKGAPARALPGKIGMKQIARILRRLAEPGAQMVVADGMDKAIVVRDEIRTAILDRELAEHMAIRSWVQLTGHGRVCRYVISAQGRDALRGLISVRRGSAVPQRDDFVDGAAVDGAAADGAAAEQAGDWGAEGQGPAQDDAAANPHADQHRVWEKRVITDPDDNRPRRTRVNIAESPLLMLARRREANGKPFLAPELVAAGERLREDFELAQMGPRVTQNWDRFLTSGISVSRVAVGYGGGSEKARDRVAAALRELGPGMGDLCLRVCCFLEGIEMTERRLGWSARSGKIVLRLALMRLDRHYTETYGSGAPLIG